MMRSDDGVAWVGYVVSAGNVAVERKNVGTLGEYHRRVARQLE